jgi:hypothetical protein
MPVEFPYETRVKVDNQHQGHKVAEEKCARSEPEILSDKIIYLDLES